MPPATRTPAGRAKTAVLLAAHDFAAGFAATPTAKKAEITKTWLTRPAIVEMAKGDILVAFGRFYGKGTLSHFQYGFYSSPVTRQVLPT